eukprot:scaffold68952_cov54-Phaeocystis_antarctica.AAC.1
MVGEVARGLSLELFGGASSEVRRCNCSVVDDSCSSLAGLVLAGENLQVRIINQPGSMAPPHRSLSARL